jgi:hypothetical protein
MADQYTPLPVKGLKTPNSTAPTNDQVPVMPATATNTAPSFTEGNEVKLSTDLAGNLRVTVTNAQVEITNDTGNALPISATTAANSATNPIHFRPTNGTASNSVTAPLFAQLTSGTAALNTGSGTAAGSLRVSPATDVIQQISATTASNATTNPLFARLTDGTTNLASGSGTAAGSLRVSPATDVTVNVSRNQTANSTTNAIFTQITNGAANNATTAPLFAQLTNGSANLASGAGAAADSLRVTHATDTTINVSRNQTANGVTNGIFTQLTDGTSAVGTPANPLFVQSDFSTGAPKATNVQTTNTAAGATATLNSTSITTGKVGQLAAVIVTSSVRYKAVVESFNGTTATTIAVLFGEAFSTQSFTPIDNTLFTQAGGATNVFRVQMTNADNLLAADLYAQIAWFEV